MDAVPAGEELSTAMVKRAGPRETEPIRGQNGEGGKFRRGFSVRTMHFPLSPFSCLCGLPHPHGEWPSQVGKGAAAWLTGYRFGGFNCHAAVTLPVELERR